MHSAEDVPTCKTTLLTIDMLCGVAGFPSAPNLTAAAAAQGLDWAPVSVQSLAVVSYGLTQSAGSATALLNLTVNADLGVSGSLSDVATAGSSSRKRSLLSVTSSKQLWYCYVNTVAVYLVSTTQEMLITQMEQCHLQPDSSGQAESVLQIPGAAMLS